MLSTQGYKRLNEMFETYRATRLAQEERERETNELDWQLPSEDDIEQEFLETIAEGLILMEGCWIIPITG